ncbi:hypothetical protein ABE10_06135, partial [Bacillus toyonensis]|nr:hypothetical protein [Bacillus toyonensis]
MDERLPVRDLKDALVCCDPQGDGRFTSGERQGSSVEHDEIVFAYAEAGPSSPVAQPLLLLCHGHVAVGPSSAAIGVPLAAGRVGGESEPIPLAALYPVQYVAVGTYFPCLLQARPSGLLREMGEVGTLWRDDVQRLLSAQVVQAPEDPAGLGRRGIREPGEDGRMQGMGGLKQTTRIAA